MNNNEFKEELRENVKDEKYQGFISSIKNEELYEMLQKALRVNGYDAQIETLSKQDDIAIRENGLVTSLIENENGELFTSTFTINDKVYEIYSKLINDYREDEEYKKSIKEAIREEKMANGSNTDKDLEIGFSDVISRLRKLSIQYAAEKLKSEKVFGSKEKYQNAFIKQADVRYKKQLKENNDIKIEK